MAHAPFFFSIISHLHSAAVAFAPDKTEEFVNFLRFFFSFSVLVVILMENLKKPP
jgi:hypothetical protein